MKRQPFLTVEEIKQRQLEEQASDKERKLTPEQIQAIYTNGHNVLVSASAGSGKTFVMVQRIVDMLQRGVKIDELFISTFTVKAAGELKERIEAELNQVIAQTKDTELRQHLSQQLSNLNNADIGTMDAFTQKLVMTYGYTLQIAPNFRILQDKNDQYLLKKEVYERLFAQYSQGDQQELFYKLVRNFTGGSKSSRPFQELVDNIYIFSQSTSNPTKWLQENFLRGAEQADVETYVANQVRQEILPRLFEAHDFFKHHLENVPEKWKKAKYLTAVEELVSLISPVNESSSATQVSNVLSELVKLANQSNYKALTNSTRPSDEDLQALKVEYNAEKQAFVNQFKVDLKFLQQATVLAEHQEDSLPLLKLLQQFVLDYEAAYFDRKRQENTFEFSDISHLAIAILEKEPAIRKLYQDKYHEVMVDEYQDNNQSQERMLDLLSNGHNRFMVGDIKQSIYRFRQADPMIFQEKFDTYRENPAAGQLILLKENFRSQMEVLDSTNDLFTRLMDRTVGEIDYDETHKLVAGRLGQTIAQPQHETVLWLYDKEAVELPDETEVEVTENGQAALVAKEIVRLHNEEKVKFEDIAILVQSRDRNPQIMTALQKAGIPVVVDKGNDQYLQSIEVTVMLDTLRTIQNPLNDFALVALLKSPMFAFDEDELTRIALQADQADFYEKMLALQSKKGAHPELATSQLQAKIKQFLTYLEDWRQFSKSHSIYDLIWKVFNERFYYDYVGALPNGEQRQANLYALGLRANQYEQTGFKGLPRFIGMMDTILQSKNDLAEADIALPKDAVQLMTIHHSKGLEFPYVFVMGMDKSFSKGDTSAPLILSRKNGVGIRYLLDLKEDADFADDPHAHLYVMIPTLPYWQNKEELRLAGLSERMRLLYVAMTRAVQRLYLVGQAEQSKLKIDGQRDKNGRLSAEARIAANSFQKWVLAVQAAFAKDDLHLTVDFFGDDQLTPDQIGQITADNHLSTDDLHQQRQQDEIRTAIDQLENVEKLNQIYAPAIELPSVRTPSQIKKLYEPVLGEDNLDIMEKSTRPPAFTLPDFAEKPRVTGAEIGSAMHELMQRLPIDQEMSLQLIADTIAQVNAPVAVKEQLQPQKVLNFFNTDLGMEITFNSSLVRREAPFAVLQTDPVSKEQFVLRGIVDGYILYDDHIVLFDYKTDHYRDPQELVTRYHSQMDLYAQALRQAYGVKDIQKNLILLGGAEVQVISLDDENDI